MLGNEKNKDITVTGIKIPLLRKMALVLASSLILTACGGETKPVITQTQKTAAKTSTTEKKSEDQQQISEKEKTIEEVTPSQEISVTGFDGDQPSQSSITSIIEQLQLTKPDTANSDEGLDQTQKKLKPSVPEAPPSNVIWTLDTEITEEEKSNQPKQAIIPEGKDPSLAADALAAAFAMIQESTKLDDEFIQETEMGEISIQKTSGNLRVSVLMPLSGSAKEVGLDMRRGAELAIFTLGNPNIDLTFHDTANDVDNAVLSAINQGSDLIIGPLYASKSRRVRLLAQQAQIPVLSFSNDSTVAGNGVWLIGQTPEQDISVVLNYALQNVEAIDKENRDKPNIIIVAQDNDYGKRVSDAAINLLRSKGGASADLITLNDDILNDENALRASIKNLTGWLPPSSDGEVPPPKYDIVLIAGNVPFSLRVAPVLSWYDLDPEKVKYISTSIWNNVAILQEPSLSQGWFADLPKSNHDRFQKIWKDHFNYTASKYAILAFDAVALATTLNHDTVDTLSSSLTTQSGFAGFSGLFRLLEDGGHERLLEIREIRNNSSEVIVKANKQF